MRKKRAICVSFVLLFCAYSGSFCQQQKRTPVKTVTLFLKQVTVAQLFIAISRQTDLNFIYNDKDIDGFSKMDINANNEPLDQLLNRVFANAPLDFEFTQSGIVVRRKKLKKQFEIRGQIIDGETGSALTGASVRLAGSSIVTQTARDGKYEMSFSAENPVLEISFVGYPTRTLTIASDGIYNVQLKKSNDALGNVVITGLVDRRKASFTGASSTYTGEELKKAGMQNVLKSLQNLEPSFLQVENLAAGSNPNQLPNYEIGGTSSFPNITGSYAGNPNEPLFILNGFQSDLQTVVDLDINLIQSVTVLRDASAKAIYGSRASNGVVVIETARPKPGALSVYYSGAVSLEIPDLTSYNLANAGEKLEIERLSGRYSESPGLPDIDNLRRNTYNNLYKEVLRGVNTYWLSDPLRTGIGNQHTLNLGGGDNAFTYQAGLSYKNISGAMKTSSRNTVSGNVSISYRMRNLQFRNYMSIISNKAQNPFQSFSLYAQQNPYWRKMDKKGAYTQLLSDFDGTYYNPLWDAQTKSVSKTAYTEYTDNFDFTWDIRPSMRLIARANVSKNTSNGHDFRSPLLTEFLNSTYDQKGSYLYQAGESYIFGNDLNLTYSHVFGKKHILFTDIGTSMQLTGNEDYTFEARGFPDDIDNLFFAYGYANSKPNASEGKTREFSMLGIVNYSYDDRFFTDISVRRTGSSQFGADSRWGMFWSTGLGWNLHREAFIRNSNLGSAIKLLKLRGSIGYTGSQNFNPYQSLPTYEYYSRYYYNGAVGAYLQALPNRSLQWQSKYDKNIGLDVSLWSKLDLSADYYIAVTQNSISQLSVAPSVGFGSYTENIGDIQNIGYQAKLRYLLYSNTKDRSYVSINATIAGNTNTVKKISNALKEYNNSLDAQKTGDGTVGESTALRDQYTRPASRIEEGYSLNSIWGVQSAGIDPLNGREKFIRPNGEYTYVWNNADQVVIGNSRPKMSGTFGVMLDWKGFSLNTICSYSLGGDLYNTTLVDKVENADVRYNVDKRILYDRWKQPGDVARFKDISDNTYTKPTSRFVMKNNQLSLSTINIGYDFRNHKWIKRLNLRSLKVSAYTNDLNTFSSIQIERGTSYPFARNFYFSIQANF